MQTTINWREYPAEKPPIGVWLLVRDDNNGKMGTDKLIKPLFGKERWKKSCACCEITHFALPEDITTTDTQKEGEE